MRYGKIGVMHMNENDIKQLALNMIQDHSVFFMATVEDGKPRLRPMTCLHADGFKIWTTTKRQTPKMAQLLKHNEVEACFLNKEGRQLRVHGTVKMFEDEETWSKLPISPEALPMLEDPDYILLLIEPQEVLMLHDWSLDYKYIPLD